MERECLLCSNVFKIYRKREKDRKYCSHECRLGHCSLNKKCYYCKKYFKRNKENYNNTYCSEECSINSGKYKERYCKQCEGRFLSTYEQNYCSEKCVGLSQRKYKECMWCGEKFHAYSKNSKYCSKKCFGFSHRVHKKTTCKNCDVTFYPKNGVEKFCSKDCYNNSQLKFQDCSICEEKFYHSRKKGYCNECYLKNKKEMDTRECKFCRTVFFTKYKHQIFCSLNCKENSDKQKYEKNCQYCNKNFHTGFKNQKFCSSECSGKSLKIDKKCSYCNQVFHGGGSKRRFCSKECSTLGIRKLNECVICNVDFYPGKNKNQKTCSEKCKQKYKMRNKIIIKCEYCQNSFIEYKSMIRLRTHEVKFCSVECRNKKWEEGGWHSLKMMNLMQQQFKPTRLEILGYSLLDNLNIYYVKQFEVKEKFLVDAFIPDYKIIIQFDGDYWHGNPIKFPELSERQIKQVKRDKSQNAYLNACGYNLIRIWETDLKANHNLIQELLSKYIDFNNLENKKE